MWAAVHAGCGTPVHEGGWGTRTPCRCQSSQSCLEPRGAATSADSHRTKSLCWSAWWENQIWETIPSSQQTFRRVTMRKQMCALVLTLFSFIYICQHTGRAPHRWRHQLHLHFLQYCTKIKTVYYFCDLSFCSLFPWKWKLHFPVEYVMMCVWLTALWEQQGVWRVPPSAWRRCFQINSYLQEGKRKQ